MLVVIDHVLAVSEGKNILNCNESLVNNARDLIQ